MQTKTYFSYIRVSTQKQGLKGTSLAEQQAAINSFAEKWGLPISQRFEERETAAKQGRPVFLEMLKLLKDGRADGVVIHKIDRSARNLKDWADLGTLIDKGIEVHFAAESLDLNSRGGRLSADIQAVVAADYIRNLAEEAKKGLYGRLKQGLFPFRAPTGYLDRGTAKPKEIDPVMGPLVRKSFELYATGDWSLESLADKMNELGLITRDGKKITRNGMSWVLHSPFYTGIIRIQKTNQTFAGIHEPLISKSLFDDVQDLLSGKANQKEKRHRFQFRRFVHCSLCGNLLSGEVQKKQYIYYRCHSKGCTTKACLREEDIFKELEKVYKKMRFTKDEFEVLRKIASEKTELLIAEGDKTRQVAKERLSKIDSRNSRLTDALVEGVLDEAAYKAKREELLQEELGLKEEIEGLDRSLENFHEKLMEFLELANSAYLSLISATPDDRRDLIRIMVSNISSDGKSVVIKLKSPFEVVASRPLVKGGWGSYTDFRTAHALLGRIFEFSKQFCLVDTREEIGLQP